MADGATLRQRPFLSLGGGMVFLLALIWAVAVIWFPTTGYGQGETEAVSLVEYQDRVAMALQLLEEGGGLEPAQALVNPVEQVMLASGETVTLVPLLSDVVDVADARDRLRIVQRQLDAAQADSSRERLAALERVLDRLNLDRLTLGQRIRRWLNRALDWLWPEPAPGTAMALDSTLPAVVTWSVVALGGLLLAYLLSYWLQRLLAGFVVDAGQQALQEDGTELPITATAARHQAAVLAESGSYRQAVRRLYLAALLHLDERGILRFRRNLTNQEVLTGTDPDTSTRRLLQPVIETFDQVWYGVREPDRVTYERYRAQVDRLTQDGAG
jgi:hypothetical protein